MLNGSVIWGKIMKTPEHIKTTKKRLISAAIIGNAIIWAAVILSSAYVLEGTGYMQKLIPVLGGGSAVSLIILGGLLRRYK